MSNLPVTLQNSLTPNGIYIGLSLRPDGFHWMIWVSQGDESPGVRMHATNREGGWKFVTEPFDPWGSLDMSALIIIGKLGSFGLAALQASLEKIPLQVPDDDKTREKTFTCRVWVRQAVRVLVKEKIIKCSSIDELEDEAKTYGEENRPLVEVGKSGVFIRSMRCCGME